MAALVVNQQINEDFDVPEEIDLNSPSRHPRFYTYSSRFESYPTSWIKQQSPRSMSCAGFYFTDISDVVQCFHCGIRLGNWNPYDDPWIEHARWSPDCEYVIAIKGAEFPANVQAGINYDDDLEADGAQNNEVSNSDVPYNLSADLGDIRVRSPYTNNTYTEKTVQENPLLTPAAQSVLEMGYLPRAVNAAVQHVLQEQGWEHLSAESLMNVILDMEDEGILENKQIIENTESSSSSTFSTGGQELEQDVENSRQRTLCKVCCTAKLGIIFLPCRHLTCCPQCAPALNNCPVCRQAIEGTIRAKFDDSD